MNCADYTKMASAGHDGPLLFRDRARMFMHHLICIYCRRFSSQLAVVRQRLQKHNADAKMPAKVRIGGSISRILRVFIPYLS